MKTLNTLKIMALVSITFLSYSVQGQINLVPNPSFEDTVSCPWFDSDMGAVKDWSYGTVNSSDYFNSCSFAGGVSVPSNFVGYQAARTGNAYAGIYAYHPLNSPDTSYREYIEVRLIDSLEAGIDYYVEFHVSLADSCHYAIGIGAYLSLDSVFSNSMTNLSYSPQITTVFDSPVTNKTQWTKVSGVYSATGGEKYLVIGNFMNNGLSDTVNVGAGGSPSNIDYQAAYFYIDDVSIYPDSINGVKTEELNMLKIYPNPSFDGKLNIESNYEIHSISVFSIEGNEVFSGNQINQKTTSLTLKKGNYIIEFKTANGNVYKKIQINN